MSPVVDSRRRQRPRPARGRSRTAIGVALLAVAALAVAIGYLRPDPFADTTPVRAAFKDAAGAGGKDTEVRMAGARVGKVGSVERVGDGVTMTLEIDKAAAEDLKRDASAELRPRIAFEGTAFVELRAGSESAPPLGDGGIPRAQTRNYVGLYDALRFARAPTRAALRDDVDELARVLGPEAQRGLQQALRRSPQTVEDLAPAARAARGSRGHELAGAVRGAARTFDAVANEERSLVPFLREGERTFAAVDVDGGAPLDSTLRALPPALRSMDRGGRALEGILDRLDPLARDLRPGLAELAPTLRQTRSLLREARPALVRATPLIGDLRHALRTGSRSTPSARRLLLAFAPTLRLFNSSLVHGLRAPTPLGIPAYLALINAFNGGGGSFRAFQTDAHGPGRQGNGHFLRFEGRFFSGLGTPAPPCALLAKVNPQLADQLRKQALCVP